VSLGFSSMTLRLRSKDTKNVPILETKTNVF
jgi:hypothetical protein